MLGFVSAVGAGVAELPVAARAGIYFDRRQLESTVHSQFGQRHSAKARHFDDVPVRCCWSGSRHARDQ